MRSAEYRTYDIYHCTACGQPICEFSGSGNNFGMRVWSDGKEECKMRFERHWLVLCPHCRTPLWMDELECHEEFDNDDDDEKNDAASPGLPEEGWPDLELPASLQRLPVIKGEEADDLSLNEPLEYEIPAFADYLAVLPTIKQFPEKVFELRLRAWWSGNDRRRGQVETLPLSPVEADNLQALLLLFGTSPYDRWLKAEALRELGRFAEAAAVLQTCVEGDMAVAVSFIKKCVAQQDSGVRLLVGNGLDLMPFMD